MKRIAFILLSILFSAGVFAQEPGAAEKNAGNDALKAKIMPKHLKNMRNI